MENLYVTSEITLNKTAEKRSSPIPTNTEFFSYDQRVAKKTINFQFKGEPLDLSQANVILGFDFVTAGQSVIFESDDGSIKIMDPAAGKVNVMLPNDIYAYSGSVIIYVFVEFSNGQSLDYPAFSTEFQESWLDQDLEEMAQFYVKRFEDLRNLVLEQVSGIDRDLTEFEDRIQNIELAIDSFDVDQLAQEIAQELEKQIADQLDPMNKEIREAQQQLETLKRGLSISEAWSWSEDGTDRFTTVYPRKNLWDGTLTTAGFVRSNDGRHIQRTLTGGLTTMSVAGNRFMEADGTHQHRTHTGFLFLNGECLTADQVPTRFAGTTSTSNGFRLNYNNYDLQTGYFETAYQMFHANNSNILQVLFPAGVLKAGDVIDIYDLKIEETFANDFRAQGVYTTPEALDPVNAFPQYHAYALQRFTTPARYSRFEFTREAIALREKKQNEKMNQLAQRITDLGG
ncbi:hypothetical protein ACPCF3_00750 [Enterococcus mundtii]